MFSEEHLEIGGGGGFADLLVVETPDAVLVADRQQGQAIKAVVSTLKRQGREERLAPRRVLRPWGITKCWKKPHYLSCVW